MHACIHCTPFTLGNLSGNKLNIMAHNNYLYQILYLHEDDSKWIGHVGHMPRDYTSIKETTYFSVGFICFVFLRAPH